ncbi:MAG: hypothetical protein CVU00_11430 [Bacteroidetes bacterium HGW-Bacteroidetes-17]|jgi:hypothetical protein|nr:MAG: hypothetical protein CVU00_11430 [Bacteroidetes bacterium HGW-Bacteroidetes-17]
MKLTIIILLFIYTANTFSQSSNNENYIVGKGIEKIIPSERKYLQFTENENGLIIFQSILTRKIENLVVEGTSQMLITQTYQMNKFIDVDSSYCNPKTLQPLAYFTDIQSEGHKEKVKFTEKEIENTIIFKDSISKSIKDNKGFYNGVIMDDIIATMPLKTNTKFSVKLVNPGLRYFEYLKEIEVLGQEEIEVAGLGKINCWKIVANRGKKNETLEWYSVKNQIQIKKKYDFKNGRVFYRIMLASG